MKQNLIVFLADMFNVLEIHPVKCVRYPGVDKALRGMFYDCFDLKDERLTILLLIIIISIFII